jgi:hypothetical protein
MSNGDDVALLSRTAPAAAPRAAATLERELAWLDRVLQARLCLHFGQPCEVADVRELALPALSEDDAYARLVGAPEWGFDERLVLALALAPHVRPQLLDTLFVRNRNLDRGYTEFGGWKGRAHGGFLPTCETAAFLLAGEDLARRFAATQLFDDEHWLQRRGILRLELEAPGEPAMAAALLLQPEFRELLTTGRHHKPDFSTSFPAHLITTHLAWSDLVLGPDVMDEISAITTWLRHADMLLHDWQLAKAVKPGYRSLFFGPPGTGKTLTATLIGQATGADVYRIDLSMIVSKFIGETEKNLARIFDAAEDSGAILLFDEADALFGKRSEVKDSHDRYANIEVSYLLQRMEAYRGLAILTTNQKAALDPAFQRRLRMVVNFPFPDLAERREIWRRVFPKALPTQGLDVDKLARLHMSGGQIRNIAVNAAFHAAEAGEVLSMAHLLKAAHGEAAKRERPISDAETRGWV